MMPRSQHGSVVRRRDSRHRALNQRRFRGCKRQSDNRVRCNRVSFFIGDTSLSGRVTVWTSLRRGKPKWNFRYRVRVLDEYCAFVLHRTKAKCSDIVRVERAPAGPAE
jgi:hypothetical protein